MYLYSAVGQRNYPACPLSDPISTRVTGDFSDRKLLSPLIRDHAQIVHLAYATTPKTSYTNPLDDLIQNLPATEELFSLATQHDARLVLISSGGTVYGVSETLPIGESHPTHPVSPYGVTKLTI